MDLIIDTEFKQTIPSLKPEELSALEQSLIKEGCRDALVVWAGQNILLDGHHRYELCRKHNIAFRTVEMQFNSREDAMVWVIQNQFSRRNINAYQRSVLALKLEEIFEAKAKANERAGGNKAGVGRENSPNPVDTDLELAKIARVSDNTIARVKKIKEKATPKQKAKLESGDATINQVYTAIRRQEVKEQVSKTEWPSGKYRVIYADPPWQYSNTQPDYYGVQDDHYPTMPLNEICALPVSDLALENAVLFLWATSPILEDAFKVINAWGFKYKASFVWDKIKHNMGHYNSVRHEFLLVAVKGSCQPDTPILYDSVQSIEKADHSRKPEFFRQMIEKLYPHGPKVELFGREIKEGWVVYGNQIATTVSP